MTSATLRRDSLRRQLDLLTLVRDRMRNESEEDFDRWATALVPLTDKIHHELMALEGVPPYPHPMDAEWWTVDGESAFAVHPADANESGRPD